MQVRVRLTFERERALPGLRREEFAAISTGLVGGDRAVRRARLGVSHAWAVRGAVASPPGR